MCITKFGKLLLDKCYHASGKHVILTIHRLHLPRAISSVCSLLLRKNGTISCKVTSARRSSSDLPQGGLGIPCKLIFAGASRDISKVQRLITVAQRPGLEMSCKKDDDAEPEKKEGKRSKKEQPEKKQVEIDVPNFSE